MLLANNDLISDARVQRQARSLAESGFSVLVLAQPSDRTKRNEKRSGYRVLRVDRRDAVTQWFDEGILRWLKNLNKKKTRSGIEGVGDYFKLDYAQREKIDSEQIDNIKRINQIYFKAALRFKPHICHCHDLDSLLTGVLLKEKYGCKLVYDAHELWTQQQTPRTTVWNDYFNGLEKTFISQTDKVITVNSSIAKEISQKYSINLPVVLFNCPVYKEKRTKEAPDFKDLPLNKKIILYHGAYERERGLEELIRSAQYIKEAILVFRGYGALEQELKKMVKELGLENKIFFLKPVATEDILDYSTGSDIGVIPYLDTCLNNRFTTPNKLFEYMLAGLAVAGSDLPELRNIILDNQIGIVLNPADSEDIANKINLLLADIEKLNNMKERSKDLAKNRYNWDIEKQKLIKMYKELFS